MDEKRETVFVTPNGEEFTSLKIRTEYDEADAAPHIEVDAVTAWLRSSPTLGKEKWRRALGNPRSDEPIEFDRGSLGDLLQEAGTFLRETEYRAIGESAKYTRTEAEQFLNAALAVVEDIKKVGERLVAAESDLYKEWEETQARMRTQRRKFAKDIESLGEDVHVPYGLKELVEIAERFEHLSPEAWGRVFELAKAMKSPATG